MKSPGVLERTEAVKRHLAMSLEWKGERLGVLEMRRHYSNYYKGIPNFKEQRMELVTELDPHKIFEKLNYIEEAYAEY